MTRWTADYFRSNRRKLGQHLDGGLIALAGHIDMQRRNDMAQPFSQEPNFWYLTGVDEPGWRLIYDSGRDHCWLVRPEVDEVRRIFDGGLSDAMALDVSGADEIVAWKDQEMLLRQQARKHSTIYTLDHRRFGSPPPFAVNPALADIESVLGRIFHTVSDAARQLADERAVKSDQEVKAIRDAAELTVRTFSDVRKNIASFRYEYEIEAEFTYAFRRSAANHAYDPIVASGGNACTLHYTANTDKRRPHSTVLIDIGAEVDGYCADITRTYAWGGQPTKRQRLVHGALEAAHQEIIDGIMPNMPIADYQRMTDLIMKRHLVSAGLLSGEGDSRYREYFPHAVSHGLGIDVHDSLGTTRVLRPGMVITVEPGIYIRDEAIGMRIEDNILITDEGTDNLSVGLSTSLV